MNQKIEIEIPEPLSEMLLVCAAENEVPVEEIIEQMLKKYLRRREEHAD